jgi:hypothetical protein
MTFTQNGHEGDAMSDPRLLVIDGKSCKTPRVCPHCQEWFTPTRRGTRGAKQVSCGKPACWSLERGLAQRGRPKPQQSARQHATANWAIRERLRGVFDELSVREIELFRWVWKAAHTRGYWRGYNAGRRAA